MPTRPKFRWDERSRRFRASSGRFLPASTIRNVIDGALRTATARVAALTDQLRDRSISLVQWEQEMRRQLKSIHVYSALAAKGGRAQLTPAERGRIGATLKQQYQFLARFAADIESGKQAMQGGMRARARLYANAGRATYEHTRRRDLALAGFTEIRSVLNPADHCAECVAEEAKGWQDPSTFTPIGARQCSHNCKCTAQYRNPETGAVAA